jgi:hypothetical protein
MEECKMSFLRISALLMLLASPGLALAHPGGLDKNGCHNDKKKGDYHCHKGPNAGKNFASKEAMLKETGGGAVAQPAKPALKTSATPAAPAAAAKPAAKPEPKAEDKK